MSTWLNDLKAKVTELEAEAPKFFEKGNNSAGTRSRKLLQEIKVLAQAGREEIQTKKLSEKDETPAA